LLIWFLGQAIAEELARQTNGRAHIILLGRNQAAADRIIASFPRTPEGTSPAEESKYSFIKVDATSMAEVRKVTTNLSKELDKVNFIVVSPAYFSLGGRNETSEGIDRKMACHFYGRFRLIYNLAPLVGKAAENGEQTGVMSVLIAGWGSAVDLNDLGLAKGYTWKKARDHTATYNDAVFEVSLVPMPEPA
jgi:NAD(P)-dependent dehydrogenase (short-subunit alcohol dehydrogenase family)